MTYNAKSNRRNNDEIKHDNASSAPVERTVRLTEPDFDIESDNDIESDDDIEKDWLEKWQDEEDFVDIL